MTKETIKNAASKAVNKMIEIGNKDVSEAFKGVKVKHLVLSAIALSIADTICDAIAKK